MIEYFNMKTLWDELNSYTVIPVYKWGRIQRSCGKPGRGADPSTSNGLDTYSFSNLRTNLLPMKSVAQPQQDLRCSHKRRTIAFFA